MAEGLDRQALDATPSAGLEDGMDQLQGVGNHVLRSRLAFIAAYDRRRAWRADGARDMAQWLSMRYKIPLSRARHQVHTAHRLEDLPAVAGAFAQGLVSEEQLHALCRFARPDDDERLADQAPGWSYAETEAEATRLSGFARSKMADDFQRRALTLRWTDDRANLSVAGRLPAADGSVVEKALDRLAARAPKDPSSGTWRPRETRLADALVEACEGRIAADPDADRATTTVFCEAPAITEDRGCGLTETGGLVGSEALRRLLCDCRIQLLATGPDGQVVALGNTVRTLPRRFHRYLRARDGGCVFPGCDATRWLTPHHMRFHAHGGPTEEDNLVLLCGYHHRLVHEGRFAVEGSPADGLRFLRPDGVPVRTTPERLRPEIAERFPPPSVGPPSGRPPVDGERGP